MKKSNMFYSRIDPIKIIVASFIFCCLFNTVLKAEDEKQAVIKLSFDQNDSTRICKAIVTSEGKPVKETEVHFYVQRMYSLLPIGKAIKTDSAGEAIANYPLDLPGDKNGKIIVVAKIEDDDNFGNVEERSEIKWGVVPSNENDSWSDRSLSASRDKAPMLLIFVSNLIIAIIWGTIIYIIFQIFRIRKESQMLKSKNK
jgi:hypothetical protein